VRALPARAAGSALLAALAWLALAQPLRANPELNAAASFLIPGLGQAVNGDYGAATLHFGTAVVLARQYTILTEKDDYIDPEDREDDDANEIRTNRTTVYGDFYGSMLLDVSFYSSFGAYRDARNAQRNQGYSTPAPQETLGDLMVAPFRWEFLSRPTAFIPIAIPLYLLFTPVDDEQLVYAPDESISRDEIGQLSFVQMEGVAVGEEAFFRGVLNNGLSSAFGETPGLLGSATLFGLAHAGIGGQADPLTAGLFGLYLGWLQQRNDYEIGEGVAVHFWWNFLITLNFLRKHEADKMVIYTYFGRF